MRETKQNCEIWKQDEGLDSVWKHIERCGRVCYQSSKPSTDSRKWCMSKVYAGHMSILEHGTIYLDIPEKDTIIADFFIINNYSTVNHVGEHYYITTNMRVIIENQMQCALAFQCGLREFHTPRITISIITDIAVAREFNRHRVQSLSEESTRYCNYRKDKFGNELAFIRPAWMKDATDIDLENWKKVKRIYAEIEETYAELVKTWTPQQARRILPLGLKVQTVHTATLPEWNDFLEKRFHQKTGKVDPNMLEVATEINELLKPIANCWH